MPSATAHDARALAPEPPPAQPAIEPGAAGHPEVPPPAPTTPAEQVSAPPAGQVRVVVLESVADLEPYRVRWEALAAAAAEPNVFYEPCMLLPCLRAFAARSDLALVLILGEPPGPPRKAPLNELWGLFPLERRTRTEHLGLPHLRLWRGDYSYVTVPLVHREHGRQVMAAFLDWLGAQRRGPALLALERLPVDGGFYQLLVEELGRRRAPSLVRDRYVRAMLAPDCDAETYQTRALQGKHRKELRRQRKRLAETGHLTFEALSPAEDAEPWIAEFLALEAAGWKGREGSALGSKAADRSYFVEMARGCHRAGRLSATAVRLDGRALAMQLLLRSGTGAYAFKIAYDEAFARYSPGVLLELDLIERVAGGGPWRWIDSAADRDHPMINRVWTERRTIEHLLVGVGPAMDLLLALLPAVRWAKRVLSSIKREGKA